MKNLLSLKTVSGFTLVETMLAMAILSSGLVLLSNSWSGSFARINKTKLQHEVSILLERKMTEIDLEYRGKPLEEIPEERAEDFGPDYPNYSWKMTSKKMEMPDLSTIMVNRDEGADQTTMMMMNKMKEYFEQAIKEVKVSILVKTKKKPLEFSIVTYFVDYDKDIAIGAGP